MILGSYIRKRVEGTRFEPAIEGMRRMSWPRVWRIGDNDHRAMMTVLPMLVRADSACIDIGANRGDIVEILQRLCSAGVVHAFEPLPHLAEQLRRRFPSVILHEMALSDQNGQADFHHVLDDDAYSGLRPTENGHAENGVKKFPVQLRRLDDEIPVNLKIDLIKIDVEGAELQVLRGALDLLRRCKPAVIFEFQKERAPAYNSSSDLMFDLLVDQVGYSLFTVTGQGPLTRAAFNDIFEQGSCYNFIARAF